MNPPTAYWVDVSTRCLLCRTGIISLGADIKDIPVLCSCYSNHWPQFRFQGVLLIDIGLCCMHFGKQSTIILVIAPPQSFWLPQFSHRNWPTTIAMCNVWPPCHTHQLSNTLSLWTKDESAVSTTKTTENKYLLLIDFIDSRVLICLPI